jgi:hypothetical protein
METPWRCDGAGFSRPALRTGERAQEKLGTEWNPSLPVLGHYYAPKALCRLFRALTLRKDFHST